MSDANEFVEKPAWRLTWVELLVVIALLSLLAAILLPMVLQAREAARRSQSKNNLKQIGLALYNYHDNYSVLPPGGIFGAQGLPFHSWTTCFAPYLDASPFYSQVNFDVPWNDPTQLDLFMRSRNYAFQNPRVTPATRPDGLQLLHYAGNSWILHRNSSVTLKDIGELQHTMMAGEVPANFTPLGMPGNWRDVQLGLNTSQEAFGLPNQNLSHALLADGSVRAINPVVEPAVWNTLAGPKSLQPTAAQAECPECPADLSKVRMWRNMRIYDWKMPVAKFSLSPDGSTLVASFDEHSAEEFRDKELNLLQECEAVLNDFSNHGDIQHIQISGPVAVEVVEVLSRPKNLLTLKLSSAKIKGDWEGLRSRLKSSVIID